MGQKYDFSPFNSIAEQSCENPWIWQNKSTIFYSKHKIVEIPDLFKLSVAKFMYSFYNGGLPNHFNNYFAEIASVHKYQIRFVSLQKYFFSQNENVSASAFFKVYWSQIWSNIPENMKSSLPYSLGKQYKNVRLSCQNSCWSSLYMLVTFCNIVLIPLFSLLSTTTVAHPTPCTWACLSSTVFCCCFFADFTLRWFDASLLLLLLQVKRLQLKFGLC